MSDKPSTPAAENVVGASSGAPKADAGSSGASSTATKKPILEQNPAFRAMGLPRIRLPSRNWMIFWTVTGSFAGSVIYDKWQTKRLRQKWCDLVAPIADEPLDPHTAPRKVTIYLSAPPGDGLRSAREHFHAYIKPVLVAAAMDWDVVEGRKEGDVRHKTATKIRKMRKSKGEGEPVEDDGELTIESIREKNGSKTWDGVGGDIVIGRHTWKEYIRGLHEGYLGPADLPKEPETESTAADKSAAANTGTESAANGATVNKLSELLPEEHGKSSTGAPGTEAQSEPAKQTAEQKKEEEKRKKEEAEKPKRRFPPSPILPEQYHNATLAPSTPEIIGPSMGVRMPHLLGIRNTPIRMYRFLTRRRLADDIGRQVATAILASHRPYGTVAEADEDNASDTPREVPEQKAVLDFEERDWWKTAYQPRKEHEESVIIEPMAFDERITSRMRSFQLTSEDEDRAKRIQAGTEPITKTEEE
ncbi:mitochondrial import inner membrane translocase subunit tim54 like protein [Zymoseptoria brevis]|uniref:Mitochondrial import inner membrane translocase subunit TIM54 n=1 Tax=Zymoseptoria brevis TaxID=1047168 RepID=A0A0F4GCQ0_9PEZI|nr:mitochondrial import inner membrane translocase subunit tim54 like protein [Zymoseptoria brevis]